MTENTQTKWSLEAQNARNTTRPAAARALALIMQCWRDITADEDPMFATVHSYTDICGQPAELMVWPLDTRVETEQDLCFYVGSRSGRDDSGKLPPVILCEDRRHPGVGLREIDISLVGFLRLGKSEQHDLQELVRHLVDILEELWVVRSRQPA